ncbi:MAG TPA: tetratricopeptide repeat protein [Chitinophagaceae bacterium]|nr:tetratricopeptide repeat protein [Chitinophagaceae bacterium]
MKKGILFFLFGSLCLQVVCQKNKADSLAVLLPLAKDTVKVNLLNELTRSLWYYELDKAAAYNAMALKLADSISYQRGIAEANRCKGVILEFKGDSTRHIYLSKALSIFRRLNDKKGIAATLNNLVSFYSQQDGYAQALEVAFESLKLFEELQDAEAIGAVTNKIGSIYDQQSDFTAALDYYLKALAIRQRISDKPGTAFSLTRVGDMYAKIGHVSEALDYYLQAYNLVQTIGRNQNLMNLATSIGDIYEKQGEFRKALHYYEISRKAEEDFFGRDSMGRSYRHIGQVYFAMKKYDSAIFNFQKALAIISKRNVAGSAEVLYRIAEVYYKTGEYAKALEYGSRGLEIAQKNKRYATIKDASLVLSQAYAAMNDYNKAYDYRLQYDQAKDSVLNQDLNMRLASLQQSFEVKNRQTQIDLLSRDKQLKESELSRQKQQRYAFIVGILLFLILVIVLAGSNRQKQRTNRLLENTLSDLKATQSQLIQSEKMASLGELTAGIAHEIQNPLNFVNNFSEVNEELLKELEIEASKGNLEEVKAIAKDIQFNSEKINHHGKRADAIVKGMLLHSRTGTGQKEPTNINALCEEYLRLAYHGLRAKDKSFNAELKTDFDGTIGKINVVPQDIGRVVLNLINNAFYAVDEKKSTYAKASAVDKYEPTVMVTTRKVGEKVLIRVKDNGNGIPQKVLDKIFQPFFTTKPTGQGTGLGLSLSYDIVKAHGGELKVETKEDEGTEFIVKLPL